ncbi:MAG: 50S ribosomal protein L25/general stress protein Ctc [Campylobacterota bacterium]
MLEGIVRESTNKAATKALRRDGYLIANIYAKDAENVNAAFVMGDFIRAVKNKEKLDFGVKVDGKEYNVIVQEYQFDPVTDMIKHVDLRVATQGRVADYMVPVTTTGTPVGLKNKGVLISGKKRLRVRGAIENIPKMIELDVSGLDVNQSTLVRDIDLGENLKIMDKPVVAVVGVIKGK